MTPADWYWLGFDSAVYAIAAMAGLMCWAGSRGRKAGKRHVQNSGNVHSFTNEES